MYEVALEILNILNENNYEAYIVGGFVRDRLLNAYSNDIDIITSCKPTQISKIFNTDILDNYGCVKIEYKGFKYDITTFRKDINYINNRRPAMVRFVDTLKEDLTRRDFTINTICIDKNGNYIDLFNGINDLKKGIIKSIIDPVKLVKDDSLRILRAIRFSCIYNFSISIDLYNAIKLNYNLVSNLSLDVIKRELNNIFNSYNCNLGLSMINELNLFEILKIKPKNNVIPTGNYLSIWAQLEYSDEYNFSNKEKKTIDDIKHIIDYGYIDNYILYKYDIDNVRNAAIILEIDNIDFKYNKLPIRSRNDIDLTYIDITNLNLNVNINNIYIDLEKQILYNKLINKKEILIDYIINKYKVGDDYE